MTTDNEKISRTEKNEDSQSNSAPWNAKFGSDENLKQRKYSRTSRNQSAKPASGTAKVLLGVLALTLFTPFILYLIVKMQTPTAQNTPQTAENIMVSRNTETTTTAPATTTVTGNIVQSSSDSVSSVDINNTATTTVSEAVTTEPPVVATEAPSQRTHTVAAGETWYGIARSYGIDVYALASANGVSIESPLYPGDEIIIP